MAYPNEKRKNRAGVEAFGSGKPPQPVTKGALTDRRSGRVGGVKSRRQQPAPQDNSDIDAIFRGARESRGMVRRGMSGAQLNPDGSDPGSGFNQFMKNNPHLDTREKRQNQYAMENQQRMNNIRQQGPEAVNARRQQQALDQQIGDPNSVTGADGYKTIFDPRNPGKVLGTTAPTGRTEDNEVNRGTASSQEMQGFRGNLQQAGMQSYGSQPEKANLSDIDQIFPGQSSPPGDGAGSGLVGAGSALGAPGGDPSPYLPQEPVQYPRGNQFLIPGAEAGSSPLINDQTAGQPDKVANALYFNALNNWSPSITNSGQPAVSGAYYDNAFGQRKYESPGAPTAQFNQEQTDALEKLRGLSNFSARVGDFWPGNDYDYLQQLFPQVDPRKFPTTNSLLDAYRNLGR